MLDLEARLRYSTNFYSRRNGFVPDVRPWPDDPLTGESPYPHEPLLKRLKYRELAESTSGILSADEVNLAVSLAIFDDIQVPLLRKVVRAVEAETSAIGVMREVLSISARNGLDNTVRLQWDTPCFSNGVEMGGLYLHDSRTIYINGKKPSEAATLLALAQRGELAPISQTATHEQLHAIQFNVGTGTILPELIEAQAYRSSQDTLVNRPHHELVSDVIGSKGYAHLDAKKFDAAVWTVDRLNALGLTQEEVTDAIKHPGHWRLTQGVWNYLDERIEEEMEERGLDEEGLERAVMAADLNKSIQKHRARRIAQVVLYDTFKSEIDKIRNGADLDEDRRRTQAVRIMLRQQA